MQAPQRMLLPINLPQIGQVNGLPAAAERSRSLKGNSVPQSQTMNCMVRDELIGFLRFPRGTAGDGLAQDVSIFSSQGSVILMLVAILLMENQRRGLFWGKKVPLGKRVMSFVRKYHGYVFAWATVYTFWYHPMENTPGHLVGFLYMFLLLLQGSLFLTRIHINKYWTIVQEVMVAFHGTLVAILQGNGIWPMFAFGFGGMFVISQMHGLGWSKLTRWLVGLGYIAAALVVYSERGWAKLNEIVRIPLIEYLVAFAIAGLIGLGLWLAEHFRKQSVSETAATD